MWREHHALWKQRNEEIHGKNSQKQGTDSTTERLKMALMALCEKAEHLLEADRRFFNAQTLEDRLRASNREIHGWVTNVKPAVSQGSWRASEHDRLHNRDIREFFTATP
jgi:hypothetical protein